MRPPPPLCDCCHAPTMLERVVWYLRRVFTRKRKYSVPFDRLYTPVIIGKAWSLDPDIRKIMTETQPMKPPLSGLARRDITELVLYRLWAEIERTYPIGSSTAEQERWREEALRDYHTDSALHRSVNTTVSAIFDVVSRYYIPKDDISCSTDA